MESLLAIIPFRWHITETLVFPPYASWEDPEKTHIVRFPIYKKIVLLLLFIFFGWALWNGHWIIALLIVTLPIGLHKLLFMRKKIN